MGIIWSIYKEAWVTITMLIYGRDSADLLTVVAAVKELVDGAGDAVFTFLMILDGVILHLRIQPNTVLISTQIDSFYLMINQQNNKFNWNIFKMFCQQTQQTYNGIKE